MTRDVVLTVHVVAGALGLLAGPLWLVTRSGVRDTCGRAYHLAVAAVAASAVALAARDLRDLWWLVPVAVATQGAALAGVVARRRRRPGWARSSTHLLAGSYVALVSGVLIASSGNPVFWILPAIVAQWPIAVATRRVAASDQVGAPLP